MKLEIVILSEVSQREKDKYMTSLMCNLIYKTEIESQMEKTYGYKRGKQRGGINWEIGIDI